MITYTKITKTDGKNYKLMVKITKTVGKYYGCQGYYFWVMICKISTKKLFSQNFYTHNQKILPSVLVIFTDSLVIFV